MVRLPAIVAGRPHGTGRRTTPTTPPSARSANVTVGSDRTCHTCVRRSRKPRTNSRASTTRGRRPLRGSPPHFRPDSATTWQGSCGHLLAPPYPLANLAPPRRGLGRKDHPHRLPKRRLQFFDVHPVGLEGHVEQRVMGPAPIGEQPPLFV